MATSNSPITPEGRLHYWLRVLRPLLWWLLLFLVLYGIWSAPVEIWTV